MMPRSMIGLPRLLAGALTLVVLTGAATLMSPAPAQAHCDSIDGPVVTAARMALEQGDVRVVLPYVKPAAEAELTAVFEQTRSVRAQGGQAQLLADRHFFETAVRLHRVGEGASYTGLKMDADVGPALVAAEQALESGSLEAVYAVLDETVRHEVAKRLHAVTAAREHAARERSVEAARLQVEAELMFEKYVDELYRAAVGTTAHTDGDSPAGGHAH